MRAGLRNNEFYFLGLKQIVERSSAKKDTYKVIK